MKNNYYSWKNYLCWSFWKNIKIRKQRRETFTDEEINKIVFGDKDEKKRWDILEKTEVILLNWAAEKDIRLTKILYVPIPNHPMEVYMIFSTDEKIVEYQNDGTMEKLMNILKEKLIQLDYFNEFNDEITIVSNSDENINKNFRGDYYRFLRS